MQENNLSIKDQCKVVMITLIDLLNDKKINEAVDYMASFIDVDNVDDLTQLNLTKSILVITKNHPDENIKSTRAKVKEIHEELLEKFKNK